jgi:acyl-CoA synthetase (AMP-forming)/AMP-acid ligase II
VPDWAWPVDLDRPCAVDDRFLATAEAQIAPADLMTIIYTSGSTADPKGVIHSHGVMLRQGAKLAASYPFESDDRIYAPLPFFWVGGLTWILFNAMNVGATVLCSAKSGAAVLDFMERERTTYMAGWPHLSRILANDPSFPGRKFRHMRGGGLVEAVPLQMRPKNQYFGQSLGMTETCGPYTISWFDLPDALIGSLGTPMPGMEHRILDVDTGLPVAEGAIGELVVRGECMMLGLVKRERGEVFDADGWFHTGDLCSHREGHLFFHGRRDDMIKTAGANVSPREVEAALMSLPGIAQAHVSAVPDPERGAVVGAIVVPAPGAAIEAAATRAAAAKLLSSYKVPRIILVMEPSRLPMMSSSKLDRRALLKLLHESYQARAVR